MTNIFAIVVSYNGAAWIRHCIESLSRSTVAVRIIVVDNASADDSALIIEKEFPHVQLLSLKENIGFGRANNIGMRKAYDAGATHVFLLNQDARTEPDTIGSLVDKSKTDNRFGIISPMHLNGSGDALDGNFAGYIVPESSPDLFSDLCLQKAQDRIYETEFVNAAAWLLTRHCIETVGGFNPAFFLYGEDNNYVHRARWRGLKVGVYPPARIYHDREMRPVKEPDMVETFRRTSLMNHLNPLVQNDLSKERGMIFRAAMGEFFKGNFYYYRILLKERQVLSEMEPVIHEQMKKMRERERLCFLEEAAYEK